MGGLGNQIFQIFTIIAYAIKFHLKFKFLNVKILGKGETTVRYTFWDSFFNRLNLFLIDHLPAESLLLKVDQFPFTPLNLSSFQNKNIVLDGYFQSYKYFMNEYEIICKLIGLEKMKIDLLEKLSFSNDFLNNTISLHFRLGDYKKCQYFHPLLTYDYYFNALTYFQRLNPSAQFNVIYFCEEEDLQDIVCTIENLKKNFNQCTFIKVDFDLKDWEQMLLMSCCHHNIIANSSFSWWGAYFNSSPDKVVCYPSLWFGEGTKTDTKDLCPSEWKKIPVINQNMDSNLSLCFA
jgi:hypothetical protein